MRWLLVVVIAAIVVLPARAMAADCADLGVPGQFDVFTAGTLTAHTGGATIQGRVAAGGDAVVQSTPTPATTGPPPASSCDGRLPSR
jgi:hypothetical protein